MQRPSARAAGGVIEPLEAWIEAFGARECRERGPHRGGHACKGAGGVFFWELGGLLAVGVGPCVTLQRSVARRERFLARREAYIEAEQAFSALDAAIPKTKRAFIATKRAFIATKRAFIGAKRAFIVPKEAFCEPDQRSPPGP